MAESSHSLPRTLWLGLVLFLALICFAWLVSLRQLQRHRFAPLPVIAQVADFSLTNQDGVVTTLTDLTNHVWVADIVFTRCGGPCPRMTAQMRSVQLRLAKDSRVQLVTLTTDPDFDTPAVMHKYAEHFGADTSQWHFLTGTKAQIAALASDSLKLSAVPVNVGRRMVSNVAEREQRLIHLWGQDLYDYLARVNAMDLELFSQTVKEIRQRLSFVPGVPARMAEFASRCEQRIAAAS